MKRVLICITIVLLIITSSISTLILLNNSNKKLFSMLDEIIELNQNGNPETEQKLSELEIFWKDYYVRISFIAQSSTLDDISYAVSKLKPLYQTDSDDFEAECIGIRHWAYLIYESQFPHLWSVF